MNALRDRHPISIVEGPRRVRVRFAGREFADSSGALELHETGYAPALYLPRDDVDMALLEASDRVTHCPHKGDARYWSIRIDGAVSRDAARCYEVPRAAVAAIAGRIAFHRDRVDAIDTDA